MLRIWASSNQPKIDPLKLKFQLTVRSCLEGSRALSDTSPPHAYHSQMPWSWREGRGGEKPNIDLNIDQLQFEILTKRTLQAQVSPIIKIKMSPLIQVQIQSPCKCFKNVNLTSP